MHRLAARREARASAASAAWTTPARRRRGRCSGGRERPADRGGIEVAAHPV